MMPHDNVRHSCLFSWISSLLALFIGIGYAVFKYPFEYDNNLLIKIIIISLTLINAPYALHYFIRKKYNYNFYHFTISISILLLSLIVIFGVLHQASLLYLLLLMGVLSFGLTIYNCICFFNFKLLIYTFLTLIIAIWICGIVWQNNYLTPLLVEKFISRFFGNNNFSDIGLDNIYHMTFGQMIKTYDFPSTGLDQLPRTPYHYGSHFVLAQMSVALQCSMMDMYNLAYPIIFLPLFLYIISLVYHQSKESNNEYSICNLFFWILLFTLFVGILPNTPGGFAYKTSLSWDSLIISESYLLSMIFFFAFLSFFAFSNLAKNDAYSYFRFLLIVLLIVITGFIKISTLFVMDAVYVYLFFRRKEYKSFLYSTELFVVAVLSVTIFYFVRDSLAPNGKFELFSFYKHFINTEFVYYLIFSLVWTIVVVGLFIFALYKKYKVNTLLIEIQLLIAFVGFLPGTFLSITGGSAFYFSDIQHWTAFPIIGYLGSFIINDLSRIRKRIMYGVGIILMIATYFNCIHSFERLLNDNYHTKAILLGRKDIPRIRLEIPKVFKSFNVLFNDSLQNLIETNKAFKQLQFLKTLDTLPNKADKILFITSDTLLAHHTDCIKLPFFLNAITGIAQFDGYSIRRCPWVDYSAEYYTREAPVGKDQDICPLLTDKRFKEVVYCNIDSMTYRIVPCNK